MVRRKVRRFVRQRMAIVAVGAVVASTSVLLGSSSAVASGTYAGPIVQIGTSSNDSHDFNAVGVEALLGHEPMPQHFTDNAAGFFWIAINLPDGTFIQSGTMTHGFGCTASNYGYFVQIWPGGVHDPSKDRQTSCGQNIATYGAFQITASGTPFGYCTWAISTPAGILETYNSGYCNSGGNRPGDVMELSQAGNVSVSLSDTMGPAGALPATLTQHSYGGSFTPTAHANAYFTSNAQHCPGNATVVGKNQGFASDTDHVGMGTVGPGFSYNCTAIGAALW